MTSYKTSEILLMPKCPPCNSNIKYPISNLSLFRPGSRVTGNLGGNLVECEWVGRGPYLGNVAQKGLKMK